MIEAPDVLAPIRDAIIEATGASLVGLYVYGSVVAGGFDQAVSDIDFVAVLSDDPNEELSARLEVMHEALAQQHPSWAGRIEVVYVAEHRLQRLDEAIPRMAVISPGEPFHVVPAGPEWLLTWYPVRQEGVALIGPPISEVIPEKPEQDYLGVVRGRLKELPGELREDASLGTCAYTVLTICRGLYTLQFGNRPSKLRAAEWAAEAFPEWASLIEAAVGWRQQRWTSQRPDPQAVADTRKFARSMTEHLDRIG